MRDEIGSAIRAGLLAADCIFGRARRQPHQQIDAARLLSGIGWKDLTRLRKAPLSPGSVAGRR
jgi:hypothetical protein